MKKTEFPHLSKKRVKEVYDAFKGLDLIDHSNKITDLKNVRWPGVNVPIKKFTYFDSDGYTFRVTNKASIN